MPFGIKTEGSNNAALKLGCSRLIVNMTGICVDLRQVNENSIPNR